MTQAVSLFELATELLRVHERSAPGRVTVVPVLVDNLDAALPVLEALCALTDGRLLHTRADELQAPVPVTPDVVRLAAVEGALTTIPSGGTRRITLVTLPLDLADATFADPPIGAVPSPGERTVLAFARATIHRDLDNHEFAVIAYYDFAIDLPFRRAVWSLVVDQLADMPHATLRTLVVVAESSVDVALHCQTNRGFRFAVNDGRLLRRRGGDDLNVIAMQMAQYSEPFVLFLGAGFSRSSRMPLGNAMRDSAVRRLLN
ncbi:MAG: hypothetical protein ACREX3_18240, partial [Gammaproteobacteria bacterium]